VTSDAVGGANAPWGGLPVAATGSRAERAEDVRVLGTFISGVPMSSVLSCRVSGVDANEASNESTLQIVQ
jgi:hypothetical protein